MSDRTRGGGGEHRNCGGLASNLMQPRQALEVVAAASPEGFERGYDELGARHIDIVLAAGP